MFRTTEPKALATFVHRPGPRVVVFVCMAMLAAIMIPAFVFSPPRPLGAGDVVSVLVFVGFEAMLLSITRRKAILTVDALAQTLALVDVRWPLRGRSRQLPLADVAGVSVEKSPRSTAVRLELTLRSGDRVPVTQSYFGHSNQMDRDAEAIRALCGLAPVA